MNSDEEILEQAKRNVNKLHGFTKEEEQEEIIKEAVRLARKQEQEKALVRMHTEYVSLSIYAKDVREAKEQGRKDLEICCDCWNYKLIEKNAREQGCIEGVKEFCKELEKKEIVMEFGEGISSKDCFKVSKKDFLELKKKRGRMI